MRTYKPMHSYITPRPVSSVDISETGLLACAHGASVQIFKDALATRQSHPYLTHRLPSCELPPSPSLPPFPIPLPDPVPLTPPPPPTPSHPYLTHQLPLWTTPPPFLPPLYNPLLLPLLTPPPPTPNPLPPHLKTAIEMNCFPSHSPPFTPHVTLPILPPSHSAFLTCEWLSFLLGISHLRVVEFSSPRSLFIISIHYQVRVRLCAICTVRRCFGRRPLKGLLLDAHARCWRAQLRLV